MMKTMTKKDVINWVLGLLFIGLGISLCTKSALGISMIGATPYILHVWLRPVLPWFTQGTGEYVWEAILLVIIALIVRRFRLKWLLSFGTAVLAGLLVDLWLSLLGGNGAWATWPGRIASLAAGMLLGAVGVAFCFRTAMPLQVYEMAVTEIADRYQKPTTLVKQLFDLSLLVIDLVLALVCTHALTGMGVGTIIIRLFNAPLIGLAGKIIDRIEKPLSAS